MSDNASQIDAYIRGHNGIADHELATHRDHFVRNAYERGLKAHQEDKEFSRKAGEGIGAFLGPVVLILGVIVLIQAMIDATGLAWRTVATFPGLLFDGRFGEISARWFHLPTLAKVMFYITAPLVLAALGAGTWLLMRIKRAIRPPRNKLIKTGSIRSFGYTIEKMPRGSCDRFMVRFKRNGEQISFRASFGSLKRAQIALDAFAEFLETAPGEMKDAYIEAEGESPAEYIARFRGYWAKRERDDLEAVIEHFSRR